MRLWSTLCACLAGTAVAATASLSLGQAMIPVRPVYYAPGCVAPCDVMPSGPMQPEPMPPDMAPTPEIQTDQVASNFGAAAAPESPAPYMIGDFLNAGHGIAEFQGLNPYGVRTFKVSENQSVLPRDRIFVNYNWFNDIGGATNLGRTQLGAEKRVGRRASVGVRLPVYFVDPGTVGGASTFGLGTTQFTDVGDLVVTFKYLLRQSAYGAVAVGTAYQIPTGPATIGDVDASYTTQASHRGSIQPYLGALRWFNDTWFLHGFVAADVPIDLDDATMLFTDVGIGNYFYTCGGRRVRAVVPTMEAHINSPLNNRTVLNSAGTGPATFYNDQVFLTSAVTLLMPKSTLALGVVAPVGNQDSASWDYEFQVQWNFFPYLRNCCSNACGNCCSN